MSIGYITDTPGLKLGHGTDPEGYTGLTVILCEKGAVGGALTLGGAYGTRQMDALGPLHGGRMVHAVLLTGGSAFGLDAAGGVVQYLEEKGAGIEVIVARIPIVPTAVIFDLAFGRSDRRPDREMGYKACIQAKAGPFEEGSVGAGTGATVGKLYGINHATKGGLGSSSVRLPNGVLVGALVVLNSFGDIRDPEKGVILAGARVSPGDKGFADTQKKFLEGFQRKDILNWGNTSLVVIATNARLNKEECIRLCYMSIPGLASVVNPCMTPVDGDLLIALSYGDKECDIKNLGASAQGAIINASIRAIQKADGFSIIPAYKDIQDD